MLGLVPIGYERRGAGENFIGHVGYERRDAGESNNGLSEKLYA